LPSLNGGEAAAAVPPPYMYSIERWAGLALQKRHCDWQGKQLWFLISLDERNLFFIQPPSNRIRSRTWTSVSKTDNYGLQSRSKNFFTRNDERRLHRKTTVFNKCRLIFTE